MMTLSLNPNYLSSECHKLKVVQICDVRQDKDHATQAGLDQGKNNETRQPLRVGKSTLHPSPCTWRKHLLDVGTVLALGTQWSTGSDLTFQRLRAWWGSQTSQSRSVMKHHTGFVGFADNNQGNWEETSWRWERRFRKDESAAWAETGKINENLIHSECREIWFSHSLLHYCSKQALYNSYGRPDDAGSREDTYAFFITVTPGLRGLWAQDVFFRLVNESHLGKSPRPEWHWSRGQDGSFPHICVSCNDAVLLRRQNGRG